MDGYTVSEAASVLGVSTERVWELLARGVLAGQPEGEAGMRVFLRPRPGPIATTDADEARRPNGHDGDPNPFRELLTEFRNLTERYGQALLALGEARGEVASLRGRVELLEARIDLRLPAPPPAAEARPWADAPPTPAHPEMEEPAPPPPAERRPEEPKQRRRRGRGGRSAIAALAEALARADDPSPSELPPAREGRQDVAATDGGTEAFAAGEDVAEPPRPEPQMEVAEPPRPEPQMEVAEDAPAAAVTASIPAPSEVWAGLDADEAFGAPTEPPPADALPVAEEATTAIEPDVTGDARGGVADTIESAPERAVPAVEPMNVAPEPVMPATASVAPDAEAAVEPLESVEPTAIDVPKPVEAVEPEPIAVEPEPTAVARESIEAAPEPVDAPEAVHVVEPEPAEAQPTAIEATPEPVQATSEPATAADWPAEPPPAVETIPEPAQAAEMMEPPAAAEAHEEPEPEYVAPEHGRFETDAASVAPPDAEGEPGAGLEFGAGPAFQVETPPQPAEGADEEAAGAGEGYTAQLHDPDWFTDADLAAAADKEAVPDEPTTEEEPTAEAFDAVEAPEWTPDLTEQRPASVEAPESAPELPVERQASVEAPAWGEAPWEPERDEAPEGAPIEPAPDAIAIDTAAEPESATSPQATAAEHPGEAPRPGEEEVMWLGADERAEYADEMEVSTHAWRAVEPAEEGDPAGQDPPAGHDQPAAPAEPAAHAEPTVDEADAARAAMASGQAATEADDPWDEESVAEARAMLARANTVEWEVDDADAAAYPLSDDDEQQLHTTMSASLPDDIWVEGWGDEGPAPHVEAPSVEAAAAAVEPPSVAGANEEEPAAEEPASRLAMPGSRELDEALAALDALARPKSEPEVPDDAPTPLTGDQIVQRLRSQMTARREGGAPREPADRTGVEPGEQPDWPNERRSPAARAFRRLRRIIPR